MLSPDKIVFYDGDCGFCNYIVGFILRNEKNNTIYFATLKSQTARDLLLEKFQITINNDTFYYIKGNKIFSKSKGFFELLKEMRFPLSSLILLRFLPISWTDKVYDWIAKRRKRIMNTKCYVPKKEEQGRFLE